MIKINELRVGNNFAGGDPARTFCKVLTIAQHGVEADYQLIGYGSAPNNPGIGFAKYEDIFPIPLTEDWLERLGFQYGETIGKSSDENNDQAWSKQISNLDWLEFQMVKGIDADTKSATSWPEWRVANECSYIRQDFWGQPKYVHQLQNLYFALTGEELPINDIA